jgi:hypothetical protein
MKKLVLSAIACLLLGGVAFGQANLDPGLRDSVIIEGLSVDSGIGAITTRIWVVSDDSIWQYNMPLTWNSPTNSVNPTSQTIYFPPLTAWDDRFDTVCTADHFIRQIGFADLDSGPNPPLLTNEQRVNCWNIRFHIDPGTPPQQISVDTVWDPINTSAYFGLIDGLTEFKPAVVRTPMTILRNAVDGEEPIPFNYVLKQNYPNPFNPETNIEYALPKESDVSLTVYNLLGQTVRTLISEKVAAGAHTAHWDGRNENGENVPSGIYFYKLYTPEFSQTNKMVLLR